MKFLILIALLSVSAHLLAYEILREKVNQFPRCLQNAFGPKGQGYNLFFKWEDNHVDRTVEVAFDPSPCENYKAILASTNVIWTRLDKVENFIPAEILLELKQVEQKTNELRAEFSAEEFLKNHPIDEYTIYTNRTLSKRFGQMFSAQVFRAWIESKKENADFRQGILFNMRKLKSPIEVPFARYSDRVKIVVSFGLGWEEKYTRTTPGYILNFLEDIKSLGLPVLFLKKNPFGRVSDNIEKIIPSLDTELDSGKDLILISLCKGTPELLAAEAELVQRGRRGKILGHVNLSGMLSGAIFSDYAKEIILPKIMAPLLKMIPSDEIRDSARMVDALEYMKTSVITATLEKVAPYLDKNIFYVNITGAPMSNAVFNGKSPMKPILIYNDRSAFVDSANDGFLEMPSTLIPQSISKNQVSLILDSSHLLADGTLDEFKIESSSTRRILYYSVVKTILEKAHQD